jgi:hypothetical protein
MGSMERRNAPTDINYHQWANNNIPYDESDMRGLQVRQPLADNNNQNTMIFHLPTTNVAGIEFHFAAMDEGAADRLVIDYSVTTGSRNGPTPDLKTATRTFTGHTSITTWTSLPCRKSTIILISGSG